MFEVNSCTSQFYKQIIHDAWAQIKYKHFGTYTIYYI